MAGDSVSVKVYVPAADARALRAEGKEPAVWVREYIRYALAKRRESRV